MTAATTYGTTIFCDDIREEIGGKKTFVGCYLDRLVAHQPFPIIVPVFALQITFVEPLSEANEELLIRVFMTPDVGEELAIIDANIPADRQQQVAQNESDPGEFLSSVMSLRASPLRLEGPGTLKVRAYRGDEEFRLGSLKIVQGEVSADVNVAEVRGRVAAP
ncbi:MAG: DUF6941 family protein [Bacillota bacterium]